MNLRKPLAITGMTVALAGLLSSCSDNPAEQRTANPVAARFLAQYVDADGRIGDTANGDISHSEGQGYGLLLAESANDRMAFERILEWTETNLAVRDDRLFSWRWDPAEGAITDPNNATDGELLIAWALLRAHDRWNIPAYRGRARSIIDTVATDLLRPTDFGPVILPGEYGFENDDALTVNLSYWVFPAFERFAAEGRPVWNEVILSGLQLTDQAAFGVYELSPDWTTIDAEGALAPADNWAPEFGYNAVRTPLHVCWAPPTPETAALREEILERYQTFWAEHPPASIDRWDLATDEPAGGPAPDAYRAIAGAVRACLSDGLANAPLPTIEPDEAYYSAALKGLVSIAILDATNSPK